jgi:hypothetical protein
MFSFLPSLIEASRAGRCGVPLEMTEGTIPIRGTKGLSKRPRCITLMTTQLNKLFLTLGGEVRGNKINEAKLVLTQTNGETRTLLARWLESNASLLFGVDVLLGHYADYVGSCLSTFRESLPVPYTRVKQNVYWTDVQKLR